MFFRVLKTVLEIPDDDLLFKVLDYNGIPESMLDLISIPEAKLTTWSCGKEPCVWLQFQGSDHGYAVLQALDEPYYGNSKATDLLVLLGFVLLPELLINLASADLQGDVGDIQPPCTQVESISDDLLFQMGDL